MVARDDFYVAHRDVLVYRGGDSSTPIGEDRRVDLPGIAGPEPADE